MRCKTLSRSSVLFSVFFCVFVSTRLLFFLYSFSVYVYYCFKCPYNPCTLTLFFCCLCVYFLFFIYCFFLFVSVFFRIFNCPTAPKFLFTSGLCKLKFLLVGWLFVAWSLLFYWMFFQSCVHKIECLSVVVVSFTTLIYNINWFSLSLFSFFFVVRSGLYVKIIFGFQLFFFVFSLYIQVTSLPNMMVKLKFCFFFCICVFVVFVATKSTITCKYLQYQHSSTASY